MIMRRWSCINCIVSIFIYLCCFNICSEVATAEYSSRQLAITANIPKTEYNALYQLYLATNGSHWRWNSSYITNKGSPGIPWDFSKAKANPCADNWEGVRCECLVTECFVISLDLPSHDLQGTLPGGLKNLTRLSVLNLANNSIQGSIPNELMEIPSMLSIFLNHNFLTGSIPSNINKLTNLRTLSLFLNHLNGPIPETIYDCSHLITLLISANNLTGTISNSLGRLKNLQYFVVDVNELHGTIPNSIGNLTNMRELAMALNHFEGTLPASIGNFRNISVMSFFANHLTGTIPDVFTFNQSYDLRRNTSLGLNLTTAALISVKLQNNAFTGPFPKSLSANKDLLSIYLQNNFLSGTIPVELGQLNQLSVLNLGNNSFHGNLEANQIQSPILTYLEVSNNQFTGKVPVFDSWQLLVFYIIANNYFTGKFEVNFCGDCVALFQIDLQSNYLHGGFLTWEVKAEMQLQTLEQVYVSKNLLSGSINAGLLRNCHQLTEIFLDQNFLRDVVPVSLLTLPSIQQLNLQDNLLQGTIAKDYFVNPSLQNLFLQNNQFEGKLPVLEYVDEVMHPTLSPTKMQFAAVEYSKQQTMDSNVTVGIVNQTRLLTVDISNNAITGTLPVSWFHTLASLESFAAVGNCFTGSIPESICEAVELMSLALDGLTSGFSCRIQLFPGIEQLNAFVLASHITGNIPECLFSMPRIETLHLSGNGLVGSLSGDWNLSRSLVDLDLSHNQLTGSIPDNFQFRVWENLALSYNKISGELKSGSFVILNEQNEVITTSSLSMKVNRLSGSIPTSILHFENIDILDGNIFTCDNDIDSNSQLPEHDAKANTYSCGSNEIYNLLYLWLFLLLLLILSVSLYSYLRFQLKPSKLSNQKVNAHDMVTHEQADEAFGMDAKVENSENPENAMPRETSVASINSTNVNMESKKSKYRFTWDSNTAEADQYTYQYSCSCINTVMTATKQYINNLKQLYNVCGVWKEMLISDREQTRFGKINPIAFFAYYTKTIRKIYIYLTILLLVVYMPLYGFITLTNRTYSEEYVWTISAVLLSGSVPGIIITVFFITFICAVFLTFEYYIVKIYREWRETRRIRETKSNIYLMIYYTCLHILNFIIMLIIDIVYVVIYISYGSTVIAFTQLILAIFKIVWNDLVLWKSLPIVKRWIAKHLTKDTEATSNNNNEHDEVENGTKNHDETANDSDFNRSRLESNNADVVHNNFQPTMRETVHLLILSLSNNIVVPLLAIALVDPHCFYNAIFAADSVQSHYTYSSCDSFLVVGVRHYVCVSAKEVEEDTSYDPPFIYSYQCSSSIVINYVPVYFIMFFMIGFFIPFGKIVCKLWYDSLDKQNRQNTQLFQWLEMSLPKNLRKLREHFPEGETYVLFEKHRFVVIVSTYLCVLLSFGVIFPPLAVVGCLSIIMYTHYHELVVGRLLYFADKLGYSWYKHQLEYDCDDIASHFSVHLWLLLRLSGLVLGCMVFDTIGDALGWETAIGPALAVVFFPLLCIFFLVSFRAYMWKKREEELLRYLAARGNRETSEEVTRAKLALSSKQFENTVRQMKSSRRFVVDDTMKGSDDGSIISENHSSFASSLTPSEHVRKTGETQISSTRDTGSDLSLLEIFRSSLSYPTANNLRSSMIIASSGMEFPDAIQQKEKDEDIGSAINPSGVELRELTTTINPLRSNSPNSN